MTTAISKRDNKKWYKTIAKFSASIGFSEDKAFIGGETYWVRKGENGEIIVKGTFYSSLDAWNHDMNPMSINRYNGTTCLGVKVAKERAKRVLQYV